MPGPGKVMFEGVATEPKGEPVGAVADAGGEEDAEPSTDE